MLFICLEDEPTGMGRQWKNIYQHNLPYMFRTMAVPQAAG